MIEDNLTLACNLARKLMRKELTPYAAIGRAAKEYNVETSAIASRLGKRGGKSASKKKKLFINWNNH